MNNIRKQLTLFVPKADTENIEAIRAKYNPRQRKLINCHVTLCREDEIENIGIVLENLANLKQKPIGLKFGQAIRFDNGKGVLIPTIAGLEQFQKLRMEILKNGNYIPRRSEPHITLMHPRNSTFTNAIFEAIKKTYLPEQINFKTISLIQQINGERWKTLETFELMGLNYLRNDEFEVKNNF